MTKTSSNSKAKDSTKDAEAAEGTRSRSAITGKFVKEATSKRHPKNTVVESTGSDDAEKSSDGKQPRSAVTGKFVKESTAKRHPKQTVGKTYNRSSAKD
jgi:hypothetical protein